MHLDVSAEVLLSQLGQSKNVSSLKQAQKMIDSTINFNKFSKHIFTLNEHLKRLNSYIGLSNTTNYLKIKCDENEDESVKKEFIKEVFHWADKYNVKLEQAGKKYVYYILGTN